MSIENNDHEDKPKNDWAVEAFHKSLNISAEDPRRDMAEHMLSKTVALGNYEKLQQIEFILKVNRIIGVLAIVIGSVASGYLLIDQDPTSVLTIVGTIVYVLFALLGELYLKDEYPQVTELKSGIKEIQLLAKQLDISIDGKQEFEEIIRTGNLENERRQIAQDISKPWYDQSGNQDRQYRVKSGLPELEDTSISDWFMGSSPIDGLLNELSLAEEELGAGVDEFESLWDEMDNDDDLSLS